MANSELWVRIFAVEITFYDYFNFGLK